MRKSIVKQAKTKDEAIRRALNEIGKDRSEVDIEVLEHGSSGFLGIGSKDAVVRISYEENLNENLFDFESEIKRDSLGSLSYSDEYNVHSRSKYYEDEVDALYESEEDIEDTTDDEFDKKLAQESKSFNDSIESIRDDEEDLGDYERLQKINSYEENSDKRVKSEENLTKGLDESIDRIEKDLKSYNNPPRQYQDEDDQIPYANDVEFANEAKDSEASNQDLENQKEVKTSSKLTFESSSVNDPIKKEVKEPVTYESTKDDSESQDLKIADDFKTAKPSSVALDKQKTDIDKYYKSKEFLEEILEAMHFENATVYGNLEGSTITLNAKVEENDTGIAIGRGGSTLDAIELILRKSIDSRANNLRLNVDINNYKKRRDEKIRELARDTARKVQRTKKAWNLKYMNSYERRLAHEEISNFPNIKSHSEGQEPKRYVVVSYDGEEE